MIIIWSLAVMTVMTVMTFIIINLKEYIIKKLQVFIYQDNVINFIIISLLGPSNFEYDRYTNVIYMYILNFIYLI